MKEGAFALIDCLGFKGLWQNGHTGLMEKIRRINSTINASVPEVLRKLEIAFSLDQYHYEVKLLSDSVAISVTRKNQDTEKYTELLVIASIIIAVSKLYRTDPPHLLLRGCITYGEFVTDENFIVGPAVDATAEYMESAEGAFIWYLPPASALLDEHCANLLQLDLITKTVAAFIPKFNIPMKCGHVLESRTINTAFRLSPSETEDMIQIYSSVMNKPSMSVWLKRQHTLSFLQHCKYLNDELKKVSTVG